jgi:hypothetical protein
MNQGQVFQGSWGNPKAMSDARHEVRIAFKEEADALPSEDRLKVSLKRFALTRSAPNFTELKYVCHGLNVPYLGSGDRFIGRKDLLRAVLAQVELWSGSPKQYRRCFQGLLSSYLSFDLYDHELDHRDRENWLELRHYLGSRLDEVSRAANARRANSPWLSTLLSNRNLLLDKPCERYARALRGGDTDELQSVCAALGIAPYSWVWSEALLAYVLEIVRLESDRSFLRELDGILQLLNGQTNLRLPQDLAIKAASLTVVRYQRCKEAPEHAELRDTCVRLIGNPWVHQTAWAAHVNDEPARQMVESWLKRGLIKDFFGLLAHDGVADTRRLDYWLKWEPKITDMWFVLGEYARQNTSKQFVEFRNRLSGRRLALDEAEDINNAFVMRIGPLLVIEFSVTNNACFIYSVEDFRGDLTRPRQSIHVLKHRSHPNLRTKLSHIHDWERRFDVRLRELLQQTPTSLKAVAREPSYLKPFTQLSPSEAGAVLVQNVTPAAQVEQPFGHTSSTQGEATRPEFGVLIARVKASCVRHNIKYEDNLYKGGDFWVLISNPKSNPGFSRSLENSGFRFEQGRGYRFTGA